MDMFIAPIDEGPPNENDGLRRRFRSQEELLQ